MGGVALQLDFGDVHLMVRIDDTDVGQIYVQEEGPGFRQSDGFATPAAVIIRLRELART